MVCTFGFVPVEGTAQRSWAEVGAWSAKQCCAPVQIGSHLVVNQATGPAQAMPAFALAPVMTAPSHSASAVQVVPAQAFHVPMLICQAFEQGQERTPAWPTRDCMVHEFADAPPAQQVQVQPGVSAALVEQSEQQAKPALSTSAQRRLRRKRAAQKKSEARALPCGQSEPPSAGSNLSKSGTEHLSCAALVESIEAGGEAEAVAFGKLKGSMVQLTFERQGCRLVQAAIQAADRAVAADLLIELHGHVRDALASPHANYVIQTIITALPTAMSSFIVKELLGVGTRSARHRFGCRILCRLIEHSGASGDLDKLLGEVLAEAEGLCSHAFGHFVIESLLEHLPQHRQTVVQALLADLPGYACHRCGSHVVESALLHCSEADRRELVSELLSGDTVVSLAQHQYGSFVLKALLQTPGKASEQALAQISGAAAILAGTRCGQRLLQDLGISAVAAP